MAPRPHNSGHYTIEACNISQFTQHIRAICGLPLMDVHLVQQSVMINILGEDLYEVLQKIPVLKHGFVHLYGKSEAKAKLKMDHITFVGSTSEDLKKQLSQFKKANK